MSQLVIHQWTLWAVVGTCIVGVSFALFATKHAIQIQKVGLENPSSCTVNAWINCDAAQASSYARIAGVPVAWWGFLYYLWMALTVTWEATRRRKNRAAVVAAFFFSLMALVFTIYKAYTLFFILKVVCPVCVLMYGVNVAIFVFLAKSLGLPLQGMPGIIKGYFRRGIRHSVSLKISPNATLYATLYSISTIVLFGFGFGMMKRIEASVLQLPKIDVAEVVSNHFRQPKTRIEINPAAPIWGNPHAAVTIVEFSDFECPACRLAAFQLKTVLFEFRKHVRFYFMHFPLQIHEEAKLAARAAVCAQQKGDFWTYHDDIFRNQHQLDRELLLRLAARRGWNREAFAACLDSKASLQQVDIDIELAERAKINATPTLFVNGRVVEYWSYPDVLREILREEIRAAK